MKIIGLTGGFKTGKTKVASFFLRLGAKVIDTDKLAHKALRQNTYTYKKVINKFGRKILDKEGKIKRKKLAEEVFHNKAKLNLLNSIIHPYVINKVKQKLSEIKWNNPEAIVIIDVPLLFEAGMQDIMDKIIVVSATKDKQIQRAKQSTSLTEERINKRIEAQMSLKKKEELADVIIDNNSLLQSTKEQVDKIWKKIKE